MNDVSKVINCYEVSDDVLTD